MVSALCCSWAIWWGVVRGEDWLGNGQGVGWCGPHAGRKIERKRKRSYANVAGQLDHTQENKKGAGWA
jgi:hypothetical protein